MMSTGLLSISILPLLGANIWHSILLARRSKDGKPHTISEHAVETEVALRVHRLVHIAGAVILIIFGLGFLLPQGYVLAGWLIISGAILDALQVITLDKRSVRMTIWSYHVITAWMMAMCYLLYASAIASIAGLGEWVVISIWLLFVPLLVVSIKRRFKDFWIMQHLYFCFIALVIIAAHVSLLVVRLA